MSVSFLVENESLIITNHSHLSVRKAGHGRYSHFYAGKGRGGRRGGGGGLLSDMSSSSVKYVKFFQLLQNIINPKNDHFMPKRHIYHKQ